jgi:hypothetical protein
MWMLLQIEKTESWQSTLSRPPVSTVYVFDNISAVKLLPVQTWRVQKPYKITNPGFSILIS